MGGLTRFKMCCLYDNQEIPGIINHELKAGAAKSFSIFSHMVPTEIHNFLPTTNPLSMKIHLETTKFHTRKNLRPDLQSIRTRMLTDCKNSQGISKMKCLHVRAFCFLKCSCPWVLSHDTQRVPTRFKMVNKEQNVRKDKHKKAPRSEDQQLP